MFPKRFKTKYSKCVLKQIKNEKNLSSCLRWVGCPFRIPVLIVLVFFLLRFENYNFGLCYLLTCQISRRMSQHHVIIKPTHIVFNFGRKLVATRLVFSETVRNKIRMLCFCRFYFVKITAFAFTIQLKPKKKNIDSLRM